MSTTRTKAKRKKRLPEKMVDPFDMRATVLRTLTRLTDLEVAASRQQVVRMALAQRIRAERALNEAHKAFEDALLAACPRAGHDVGASERE